MTDTTYSKQSTGASPYFGGGQKPPKGVYPGNYNSANDGNTTPAGAEVHRSKILERAGNLAKPSYTDLTGTR